MSAQYQYWNKQPVVHSRGFSLVEIMVAIAISIILMTGIVQIFLSNKQTYRTTEAMSRMQENTRYAMHVLTRDIREAGSTACGNANIANFLTITTSWQYNFENAVTGFEGGVSVFPTEFTNVTDNVTPVAGTDAVTILSAGDTSYRIKSHNESSANMKLTVDPGVGHEIEDGDVVMVCDENQASIFRISGINAGGNIEHNTGGGVPGNCTNRLGYPRPATCSNASHGTTYDYDTSPDSKMAQLSAVAYYIATSDTCTTRCLYKIKMNAVGGALVYTPELIVEGVENMQILYGSDTNADGTADRYNTADNVPAWSDVTSVRLGLLMHTLEEVANPDDIDTTSYNVADTAIGGTSGATTIQHDEDRRLRFVAPTTVKIRNRGCTGTNGC